MVNICAAAEAFRPGDDMPTREVLGSQGLMNLSQTGHKGHIEKSDDSIVKTGWGAEMRGMVGEGG
jgi:hypothetical protein